jgi:hypothetical protein
LDSSIRARKIAGDVWAGRAHAAAAAVVVTLASAGVSFRSSNAALNGILISAALVSVGQASAPLGPARATEQLRLRALGADDDAPVALARMEGGLLGLLTALAAALLSLARGRPDWALFWLAASSGCGAWVAGR